MWQLLRFLLTSLGHFEGPVLNNDVFGSRRVPFPPRSESGSDVTKMSPGKFGYVTFMVARNDFTATSLVVSFDLSPFRLLPTKP